MIPLLTQMSAPPAPEHPHRPKKGRRSLVLLGIVLSAVSGLIVWYFVAKVLS